MKTCRMYAKSISSNEFVTTVSIRETKLKNEKPKKVNNKRLFSKTIKTIRNFI